MPRHWKSFLRFRLRMCAAGHICLLFIDELLMIQGTRCTHMRTWSIALLKARLNLKALVSICSSSTPSRSTLAACYLSMQEKNRIYSSLTAWVCLLGHFTMDAEPPGKRPCMCTTDGIIHVRVQAGCGEEGGYLSDIFQWSRAFRERLCESRKTIIEVDFDSALI